MFTGFSSDLFLFFEELTKNNNRDWFAENKSRYQESVQQPALEFIVAMAKPLQKLTPYFTAIPKKVGGSLMRIYRDTRFSKEKIPYKTNLGIHFRHEAGKNVHAPGFYFHVDPENIFVGAGIWRPDSPTLNQIRHLIDDDSTRWKRMMSRKPFRESFAASGDTLKRPPKGFDENHPLIVDLKRKDHIMLASMTRKEVTSKNLVETVTAKFKMSMPYVRFLCDAVHLPS